MNNYILLIIAIICEVAGTSMLKLSDGFTKLWPSLGAIVLFLAALVLLSQVLKTMPVGVVYAIWSGLGIAFIALIGHFVFKQYLDLAGYLGIAMIVGGVMVLNLWSKTNLH